MQKRPAREGSVIRRRERRNSGADGRVWGESPKPRPAGLPRSGTPRAGNAGEAVEPPFCGVILFRVSGFRPRKRHLREGCGLARSWRVGARMREGGSPRLTGAAAYIDTLRRQQFCSHGSAACGSRSGRRACGLGRVSTRKARAPESRLPRPRGAAGGKVGRGRWGICCGRRSGLTGGCHTGDVKCGGERIRHARSLRRGGRCAGRQRRLCGKRAAATVPVRMTGGCHQACGWHRPARPATRARVIIIRSTPCVRPVPEPVWRAKHAPRVLARGCVVWQPSGLPHRGYEKRRRACHTDTATSLRSEEGVWQAFRRDANA